MSKLLAFEPPWIGPFLASLAGCGSVDQACDCVGVPVHQVYWLKEHDPEFAASFRSALEAACDGLLSEIAWALR
jgi:hypothetical protein